MNKKNFVSPKIDLVELKDEDVIVTSPCRADDIDNEEFFGDTDK